MGDQPRPVQIVELYEVYSPEVYGPDMLYFSTEDAAISGAPNGVPRPRYALDCGDGKYRLLRNKSFKNTVRLEG